MDKNPIETTESDAKVWRHSNNDTVQKVNKVLKDLKNIIRKKEWVLNFKVMSTFKYVCECLPILSQMKKKQPIYNDLLLSVQNTMNWTCDKWGSLKEDKMYKEIIANNPKKTTSILWTHNEERCLHLTLKRHFKGKRNSRKLWETYLPSLSKRMENKYVKNR